MVYGIKGSMVLVVFRELIYGDLCRYVFFVLYFVGYCCLFAVYLILLVS